GEKPAENVRFLVFVCAFIKAVDTYPELLRMGAACPGNDFRLGASEAPPAIISIYLGKYVEGILNGLVSEKVPEKEESAKVEFSPISGLAYLPHDNTDRNRTSPVAFTGNKFEFRMLGSSMSASLVNVILDSIMADTLNEIAAELEGLKYLQDIRSKAMDICRDIIKKHKRVLFSGDGYSEDWLKEAARRGLPNIRSSVESYEAFDDPKVIKMFTDLGVYSKVELAARRTIYIEQYIKTVGIEVKVLLKCVREDILPAMSAELKFYAEVAAAAGDKAPKFVTSRISQISELIDQLYGACGELEKIDGTVSKMPADMARGKAVYDKVCPAMMKIRSYIDTYEKIASTEYYKVPSYEEMLFSL
ncbi:MAG: glutamine synthetase type III, partial [Solobacterium sp.]|nr:glutamine synthetase type III [Solobacterium sp.]